MFFLFERKMWLLGFKLMTVWGLVIVKSHGHISTPLAHRQVFVVCGDAVTCRLFHRTDMIDLRMPSTDPHEASEDREDAKKKSYRWLVIRPICSANTVEQPTQPGMKPMDVYTYLSIAHTMPHSQQTQYIIHNIARY